MRGSAPPHLVGPLGSCCYDLVGSRVRAPREGGAPPDPASALLPGSSMFRAPCMSQRRLALIFCVSVLIVLLIALILLCEWGPSLALPGGRETSEALGVSRGLGGHRGWEVPQANPRAGTWQAGTCSSHFLSVPDICWRRRSRIAGERGAAAGAPCRPERGWGAAPRFPPPGLAAAGHPQQRPPSPSPRRRGGGQHPSNEARCVGGAGTDTGGIPLILAASGWGFSSCCSWWA